MQCPKCGYEQPQSETCAKCGIMIAKFLERQLLAANPVEAIKMAVKRLSAGLSGSWISFAPDIPSDDLWAALASYPAEEQVGRGGEEVLALVREQEFDSVPGNHLLLTTWRIIRSERSQGRITQLQLPGLRSVAVTGLRYERLKLNDRELPVWALTQLKEPQRQAFIRVLAGIVRELRAPGPAQPMRINRLTDYPSYMATPGDGMVHPDHTAKLVETFAPPLLPVEDLVPAPPPEPLTVPAIPWDDADDGRPPMLEPAYEASSALAAADQSPGRVAGPDEVPSLDDDEPN